MRIADWDDAYANRDHIHGAAQYIDRWPVAARAFRDGLASAGRARLDHAYGPAPRQRLDLFAPDGAARGLVVFVHGGYWMAFDKSVWSGFAAGAVAAGWAVAVPSYTLAPAARIAEMTREIAAAVAEAARLVPGPVRAAGHSAGGHLVARLTCADSTLAPAVRDRLAHVVPISGLHDLRPLLRTAMNATLGLDPVAAAAESPALLTPREGVRVTTWVGGDERPEFLRQSALLANVWTGLGADMASVVDPGTHHFSVIDGLGSADSALTRCLLG
ncbi:alpha/beta hydrolase [Halovulum marinum]|nr:alpha/beta hydrolase fold domain-containing protein [Halovulum marinum]